MLKIREVIVVALVILSADALSNQEEWEIFKVSFKRSYASSTEEVLRFNIFKENLAKIESHNKKFNAGLSSYKLGVTQFADMTHAEFVSKLTLNLTTNNLKENILEISSNSIIPSEIDWNKLGAVTPIKNQKNCGSCWSFSATGALEGQYYLKHKKLISLSEQNLMDCSYEYGNHGCDGGLMDNAFKYVQEVGIMSENSYPYSAIDTACAFKPSESVLKIKSFRNLLSGNEDQLKTAIATIGPISVAVDALDFALYAGGIFDDNKCCNLSLCLSHGVLAVGYGTSEDGVDYWLVKNSWDTSWGEDGYIRMSRNKDNQCGIATRPSYPVL